MLQGRESLTNQEEIIVTFSSFCYPFPSASQPLPTFFRTAEVFNFTTADLRRLTSVHHRNIVNLKRVVKTSVKNETGITNMGYSLYYEPVQRGIHNRKKMSDGLNRIGNFLVQNGILHKLRESDIGYDQLGQLKVFVPPLVILGRDELQVQNKITEQDVFKSINQLLATSLAEPRNKMDRINEIDKELQEMRKKLNEDKKKKKQKREKTMQAMEPYQETEMVNEEIHQFADSPDQDNIRYQGGKPLAKLPNSNFGDNKRQSLPHEMMRQSGLNTMNFHFPIEMVNWGRQSRETANQETIQQNINCINIYHNTKHEEPKVHVQKKPYAIHHFPSNNKISAINQEGVSDSLDTYELEIGQSREMPKMVPRARLRHTVLPTSQRKLSQETKDRKRRKGNNRNQNLIYGSAGHKEFSDILKYTAGRDNSGREQQKKPVRKSNIHEESMESESMEATLPIAGHVQYEGQDYHMEGSPIMSKASEAILAGNHNFATQEKDVIHNKVSQALQKTKAAIQLLKKVRNVRSKPN